MRKWKNTEWRMYERKVLKGMLGPQTDRERERCNRNLEKIT